MINHYIDGIGSVTLKNGVVRIELATIIAQSSLANGPQTSTEAPQEKIVPLGHINTSINGLLQLLSTLTQFKDKLVEQGVLKVTPGENQLAEDASPSSLLKSLQ